MPGAARPLDSVLSLLAEARRAGSLVVHLQNDGHVLIRHWVSRVAVAGVLSEMRVSATARTAMERGFGVVLPHDAHATYNIAPAPGFGEAVPAAIASRVAEWALGDQIELAASAGDVAFTQAQQ